MPLLFQKPSAYKNLNSTQYTNIPIIADNSLKAKFAEFSVKSLCKLS
jgi:hypothetical protein